MDTPFSVLAGKYDGYNENCKYCDDFATLDEAIEALRLVNDYPWSRIEYRGASTRDAIVHIGVSFD